MTALDSDWYIFVLYSVTAEQNLTKIDKKQVKKKTPSSIIRMIFLAMAVFMFFSRVAKLWCAVGGRAGVQQLVSGL